MKRTMIVIAAVLAAGLMLVASASAKKPDDAKHLAKAACVAAKKADKAAFKATYGKRAMRTCVKGEKSDAKEKVANASQQCKDERAADPDASAEAYGSGKNGKNALGKCVSAKVKKDIADDTETFKNAAKECRAEKKADPETFESTYGSNRNRHNALGKCVSAKVKASDGEESA